MPVEIENELGRLIVWPEIVDAPCPVCLIAGGNALLEGVPGLGKTVLVRTLADVIDCEFSRIQFTPDLMPADIVGTNILVEDDAGGRRFQFQRGPIFANLLLADEINRATPKTQSALLEAMRKRVLSRLLVRSTICQSHSSFWRHKIRLRWRAHIPYLKHSLTDLFQAERQFPNGGGTDGDFGPHDVGQRSEGGKGNREPKSWPCSTSPDRLRSRPM